MTTKIIVSYDGTDNDRDALALGRVLAATGASVALAYVRHAVEGKSVGERLAERDAQELLDAGAEALGGPASRPTSSSAPRPRTGCATWPSSSTPT